jgi:hypothetical protein
VLNPVRRFLVVARLVKIARLSARLKSLVEAIHFLLRDTRMFAQQYLNQFVDDNKRLVSPVIHLADANFESAVLIVPPITASFVPVFIVWYDFYVDIHFELDFLNFGSLFLRFIASYSFLVVRILDSNEASSRLHWTVCALMYGEASLIQ